MAQIAIKGRNAASTGVSPFFLQHGYDVESVQGEVDETAGQLEHHPHRPDISAVAMVDKPKEVFAYIQARIAEAQQEQERQANRHRQESPAAKVGDKV